VFYSGSAEGEEEEEYAENCCYTSDDNLDIFVSEGSCAEFLEKRPTGTYAGAAPLLCDESLVGVGVAEDVDVGEDVGVAVVSPVAGCGGLPPGLPCRRSNSAPAPNKCILTMKRA
jgi:hypothetical protein